MRLKELVSAHIAGGSAVATAEQFLARATGHPAFAHVDAAATLAQAARIDALFPAAKASLPLCGVPLPAKDLSYLADSPCAFGNAERVINAAETDPFVAAFAARGAIVSAKTQTSELGLSAYCEPAGFAPVPGFPNPKRTPGGSSGGAAVAVAEGIVAAAHGTDGGGSLRVPAASTGTVGLKLPHDTTGGQVAAQGFLTTSVADALLAADLPTPAPRPLKVGVLTTPLHGDGTVATAWEDAAMAAAEALARAGHTVVALQPCYGQDTFAAFRTMLSYRSRKITLTPHTTPLVRWLKEEGLATAEEDMHAAIMTLAAVRGVIADAWAVDVLLTPTLAFDPPAIGTFSGLAPAADFEAQTRWTPWCTLFNMTGAGAISVPFGGRSVQLGAVHGNFADTLHAALVLHP